MSRATLEIDRQLPVDEQIFLDHIAYFVRDRDAATKALARAGFAPTPLSIQVNPDPAGGAPQPTGTGNVTAMFTRGYIEVLFKTSDTPLSRELDVALRRYPGVHLAAFAVADATAAHRRLSDAGFRTRPIAHMQRPVETPDGMGGTAAFTLARLEPGEMREGRIQILTHRTEHMVWQPRWLTHPNGALALTHITFAVADVTEAAERFARFIGRPSAPSSNGQTIALDRGRVELVTPEALAAALPELAIPATLPFAGAYGVRVRSFGPLAELMARAGLSARPHENELIAPFPPELGYGAWIFTETPA